MSRQYPLPLPQHEAMTADTFMMTASNREAVAWTIERTPSSWPHHGVILYGPSGCGKTHLLTVWADKNNARKVEAEEAVFENVLAEIQTTLPLREGRNHAGDFGEGSFKTLALDNADRIAGNAAHEEWLKHLYDAAKTAGIPLLLTATKPPALWGLGLKDIESRLKTCPTIEIKEPDDELLRAMLLKQFADRQLLVEKEVIDYLVPRLERTGSAARDTVALLDEKALEQGRKITVPFVAEAFKTAQAD